MPSAPLASTPHELLNELRERADFRALIEATTDIPAQLAHLRAIRKLSVDKGGVALHERDQVDRIIAHLAGLGRRRSLLPPDHGSPESISSFGTRWDLRLGRERDSIPTHRELLGPSVQAASLQLADHLGLTRSTLPQGRFDLVVVLGGLVRANITRPDYAHELINDGAVTASLVVGLTGERMLSQRERELASSLGMHDVPHERRSLANGLARAWERELSEFDRINLPDATAIQALLDVEEPAIIIATTPRLPDGSRPAAVDCLEWLFTELGIPEPQRILLITSPIYRLQNHMDGVIAVHRAGIQAQVVTVATTSQHALRNPDLEQQFLPQHYLQELKALVDGIVRLQRLVESRQETLRIPPTHSTQFRIGPRARVGSAAIVGGSAHVEDDSYVGGRALVSDHAQIQDRARIVGRAEVEGEAIVGGRARVEGRARVTRNAHVMGSSRIGGRAWVRGSALVSGNALVTGNAELRDNAVVTGNAYIDGRVEVRGDARVCDNARLVGPVTASIFELPGGFTARPSDPTGVMLIEGSVEGDGLSIGGAATLLGPVAIQGWGRIHGNAYISGRAVIGDACDISERHHVQVLVPGGSPNLEGVAGLGGAVLTVYRSLRTGEEPHGFRIMRGFDGIELDLVPASLVDVVRALGRVVCS